MTRESGGAAPPWGLELAEELSVLRRISERLGSTLRIEEVLEGIVSEFSELLHADACALYLKDPASDELVLTAARGYDRSAVGSTRLALGEGLTGWAAQRRKIVASADAAQDSRYAPRPEMGEECYASLLAVPIVRDNQTVAVVTLQTRSRREFRSREIRRAALLAEPIYFAIENARRYRDLEERLQEVTRLYETIRSIGTSLNLPEVLDAIIRTAARILSGRGGTLRILGEDGRVYVGRGTRAPGAGPRVGDTVIFEPRDTTTGLRADTVRRVAPQQRSAARSHFRRPA